MEALVEPFTISVKDSEALSGLCHTSICKLIASGKLKSSKVGGRRLVALASLKELLLHRGLSQPIGSLKAQNIAAGASSLETTAVS